MPLIRHVAPSVVAGLLVLSSLPAMADDSAAKRLFDEARALMLKGAFSEACPRFEESQVLEPRLGTLLNLAACHERLGKTATAWVEYAQAERQAREAGESDREALARERREVLEPRVPWLQLELAPRPPVGLAIGVDGVPVAPERWNEPLALDPGEHVLIAAAPGHEPREQRFRIEESQQRSLVLPPLTAIVAPPPAPEPPIAKPHPDEPPPGAPPPDAPLEEDRRRWMLEVGLFGGFVGIRPDYLDIGDATFQSSMGETLSCDATTCTTNLHVPQNGGAVGLSVFAGYQLTPDFHLGGRALVGPRIGGGLVGGLGPAGAMRVVGPLWLGLGALIGGGSFVATGTVSSPELGATDSEIGGTVGVGAGPLLDVTAQLVDTDQGAFGLSLLPFFLIGFDGGTVYSVPLTVFFRFQ